MKNRESFDSIILDTIQQLSSLSVESIGNMIVDLNQLPPEKLENHERDLTLIKNKLSEFNIKLTISIVNDLKPTKTIMRQFRKFLQKKFKSRKRTTILFESSTNDSSISKTETSNKAILPYNDLIYMSISQVIMDLNSNCLDSELNNTAMNMIEQIDNMLDENTRFLYDELIINIYTCLSQYEWNFPGFNTPPDRKQLIQDLNSILSMMIIC